MDILTTDNVISYPPANYDLYNVGTQQVSYFS